MDDEEKNAYHDAKIFIFRNNNNNNNREEKEKHRKNEKTYFSGPREKEKNKKIYI